MARQILLSPPFCCAPAVCHLPRVPSDPPLFSLPVLPRGASPLLAAPFPPSRAASTGGSLPQRRAASPIPYLPSPTLFSPQSAPHTSLLPGSGVFSRRAAGRARGLRSFSGPHQRAVADPPAAGAAAMKALRRSASQRLAGGRHRLCLPPPPSFFLPTDNACVLPPSFARSPVLMLRPVLSSPPNPH